MFAIIQNNQLIKTIQPHVEFELFGKTYNAKWTVRMSAAEKTSLGITDVVVQPRPDDRFYWVQENPVALVNGVPTITYTATAKLLEDREEVDEEGNFLYVKVLGEVNGKPAMVDSEERLVTKGLKTQWIEQTKENANKALAPTDWYIIRKAERGVAIPEAVVAERAKIVSDCAAKETVIKAATTIEELIAAVA
jgi:hypothetical protein